MRIPFIRPVIPRPEEWCGQLGQSYEIAQFSNGGPAVTRLESELRARAARGRSAVVVSSCTSGLHAALNALGVRGRVVMPSFTFAATGVAAVAAHCEPVLCDIDPIDLYMDPVSVERAIRSFDAAAVIVVRPFGLDRNLDDFVEICREARVPLLVDAAASLGHSEAASRGDSPVSYTEVYSLHATKAFGVGEGGVVMTPPEHEPGVRAAINFGLLDGEIQVPGLNGKMSEFQAAVALGVLASLDGHIHARRKVAEAYFRTCSALQSVERAWPASSSPWSFYPIVLDNGVDRGSVINDLLDCGVETRAYYHPMHRYSAFKSCDRTDLANTERVSETVLCLPVLGDMTEAEVRTVTEALCSVLGG